MHSLRIGVSGVNLTGFWNTKYGYLLIDFSAP